jgi:hypothetical protein
MHFWVSEYRFDSRTRRHGFEFQCENFNDIWLIIRVPFVGKLLVDRGYVPSPQAGITKPGQRCEIQGLIAKAFGGSNPPPCTISSPYLIKNIYVDLKRYEISQPNFISI